MRLCRIAALVYLLALVINGEARHPDFRDFSQFYVTGLIDRAGAWDALYPTPIPGSIYNPGNWRDSVAKPASDRLATAQA